MRHTNQCKSCNKIWESDELPNYCPYCRCSTLESTNNESNSGRVFSYTDFGGSEIKEYKLNKLALVETPILPDGQIVMMNISEATKEWKMWEDIDGGLHLLTKTPPKNSVVWGIIWDAVDSQNSV